MNTNLNKLDNDDDDYFSDDEIQDEVQDEQTLEEDVISDNEMDEETRLIIYRAAQKNKPDIFQYNTSLKEEQKKITKIKTTIDISKQTKKVMTLEEFTKKIEAEEKAKKPNKFVSRRTVDKKKQFGTDETTVIRRHFNPRFPPYNFINKKVISNNIGDINNNKEFPSLS